MERIFGGAESNDDKTTEQTSEAELAQTKIAAALDSVVTNQPADKRPSQTFEDLTHSQNAEVRLSADNSISNETAPENQLQSDASIESDDQPQAESTQADDLESRLSPMALQLLQDVKEDQKQEKAEVEARVETQDSMPIETEAPVQTAPETSIVSEPNENESVADLLARMKEDGKWDGMLGDDNSAGPVEPVQSTPEPEPTPSALDSSDDSPVESTDGEGDDVEDYMSQLLSRMRGEAPAPVASISEKKEETTAKEKDVKKSKKAKLEAPADPLKAEDFKPKQKATKIKSLEAMRELANSNARTNVKVSETQDRKAKAYLSGGAGLGAIVLSLFCLLFTSQAIIGLVCLVVAGACGFSFYKNMAASKKFAAAKQPKATGKATGSK